MRGGAIRHTDEVIPRKVDTVSLQRVWEIREENNCK